MKNRLPAIAVIAIVAIASFLLGPVLWPKTGDFAPVGAQLGLFIVLSAIESLALGAGIAFLLYGWKWTKCVESGSKPAALGLYLSIAWLLISWWPHDNMHATTGHDDLWRLLLIEYMFHVTLILAAAVLAWNFFHVMQRCQRAV